MAYNPNIMHYLVDMPSGTRCVYPKCGDRSLGQNAAVWEDATMTNAGPVLGRRASLIITAALALAGTGRARGAEAVIRVAGVVNDPNVILPLQSGIRLGLFDKVGVKVEFSGYSGGSTAMEAVAAGAADIAVFIPAGTSM